MDAVCLCMRAAMASVIQYLSPALCLHAPQSHGSVMHVRQVLLILPVSCVQI
ncbi:hypothetical protein E2C01_003028 [Portunus trituberculatus]|uniref:Uncharacterized protein n=1 Tax=Portunus trituberculatus TaxID=210409 RepID=A0A5B7CSF0_PORTR|nr:hypothetical protein [Portunus trituberculatus]